MTPGTGRVQINERGEGYAECLVIGCNMEAMLFSEENNYPLIYTVQETPHFFEGSTLGEFSELCFYLSVYGLIPFGDMVDSVRFDLEEKCLNVFCGPKMYKCHYDRTYVFSDHGVDGLPTPVRKNKRYKVLDWFDISSSVKEQEPIETSSEFVKSVYFYPSFRPVRSGFSDAVAVSYMSESELSDPDWCDTYARLKTINVMKSSGVEGTKMGNGRFRPLEVKHSHREIIPINKNEYEEIPNVEFR